jgi:GntR family transcriptional regulator/MocR family aminotransferase
VRLVEAVAAEKRLADRGSPHVEQLAFEDFLRRGELDRHLRRMRVRYRERRDAIVEALAEALPEATVHGIAAGLHATVELPPGVDEEAVRVAARERRIQIETMGDYRLTDGGGAPTLALGFGQMPEPTIRAGVAALAEVVREQALDVGAASARATP